MGFINAFISGISVGFGAALPLYVLLVCFLLIIAVVFILLLFLYRRTSYYKITHIPMLKMWNDIGRAGEFRTYMTLRSYEKDGGRFLFNCYFPKENGETTEADVILIARFGIFVIESKNYSGWIFGDEKSRTWTQMLPKGRGKSQKEHFFNPIIQNAVHIKALRAVVGETVPIYPAVAFSNRCTLKKLTLASPDTVVVKRENLPAVLSRMDTAVLTDDTIAELYNLIYPYSQVSDEVRKKHVDDILENHPADKPVLTTNADSRSADDTAHGTTAYGVCPPSPPSENPDELTGETVSAGSVENDPGVCPVCGSPLVVRTARRGSNAGGTFIGCSAFPKCRYTRNNSPE